MTCYECYDVLRCCAGKQRKVASSAHRLDVGVQLWPRLHAMDQGKVAHTAEENDVIITSAATYQAAKNNENFIELPQLRVCVQLLGLCSAW